MMASWPRFTVTVEARPPKAREGMPPPPAPALRIRAWLKVGLRAFGLICTEIKELPPEDGQAGSG
jgi:hypothetical protein